MVQLSLTSWLTLLCTYLHVGLIIDEKVVTAAVHEIANIKIKMLGCNENMLYKVTWIQWESVQRSALIYCSLQESSRTHRPLTLMSLENGRQQCVINRAVEWNVLITLFNLDRKTEAAHLTCPTPPPDPPPLPLQKKKRLLDCCLPQTSYYFI